MVLFYVDSVNKGLIHFSILVKPPGSEPEGFILFIQASQDAKLQGLTCGWVSWVDRL